MVSYVLFLSLYCSILRRDCEPFQGVISNTKTLLNNHKRNVRINIENMKTKIETNIKSKFRQAGF